MPNSVVTDMDTPIYTPQGAWLPSGEHEAESYTLRRALTVSSNRAAVRVMQLVGIGTTQTTHAGSASVRRCPQCRRSRWGPAK